MTQAEFLFGYMHFAVRTTGDAATVQRVRTIAAEVDPKYPLYSVSSMTELLAATTRGDRFVATLLASFALLALCLAAVGIHGVVAYQVAQRTREIGLRMALGADRGQVLTSVLRNAAGLAAVGVAVGVLGAAGATRVVRGFLYEVSPLDPITFGGVGVMLMAVACVAAAIPAIRAATMDPAGALRND
jgi:ABC-type antimicrobial peptide transport system permease subunit